MIEKSTVIDTDTTIVSRIADKDSTSFKAKIDSIIIEEYEPDDQVNTTPSASQHKPGHKISSCRKGNDTSKGAISPKKKIKIYGINLSGTWLSTNDSLNKKMTHQATTNSEIKEKIPAKDIAGGKNIYALIALAIALFVGYVFWKNAVQ